MTSTTRRARPSNGLLDYLDAKGITVALARLDPNLVGTLDAYGSDERITPDHVFGNLIDAYAAFTRRSTPASG